MRKEEAEFNRSVLLVVSIDTECDKADDWAVRYPMSFRSIEQGIPEALTPVFKEFAVRPTYLVSPEVIQSASAMGVLNGIKDCELGTHLHGEFIAPYADNQARVTSTPQCSYTRSIEAEKITNLTEKFFEAVGRRPTSFRAGRFGIGKHTLEILDQLGYIVDSSVVPFKTCRFANSLATNFWGAGLEPYHPSEKDFRSRGGLRVLEVPVSHFVLGLQSLRPMLLKRLSDSRAAWLNSRLRLGWNLEKTWIRPFRGSAETLMTAADTLVQNWSAGTPAVVNVMFHSVEVIPGASPYAQTRQDVRKLCDSLSRLFEHLLKNYTCESVTLSEVASRGHW